MGTKMKDFQDDPRYVDLAKRGIPFRVILDVEDFYKHNEGHHADNYLNMLGFKRGDKYKFCMILGELANMKGHYVVVGKTGQIVSGLHGDIFYLDEDDELGDIGNLL